MKKIAIIYHYLAHYRLPIFRELAKTKVPSFTFISGRNELNDIRTINESLASKNINEGGFDWEFVDNVWLSSDKLLWQKGILSKCITNAFDEYIFLGNPYFISTWVCAILLRLRKKKVYFWTHGLLRNEKGIKGSIRRLFLRIPNGLLLYGNHARDLLIQDGFRANKLKVIYNSLDYDSHCCLRGSLSNNELFSFRSNLFKKYDLPQLIFIGRLTKQKKLFQIVEAIKILNQKAVFVNLLFVGEGEEKVNLQKLVKENKIDDFVHFHGSSYQEEINYKLIASSDICVSPGEVGLTAIHSLSYGTPVITHNNFNEQMPEFEAIQPDYSGDFFEQDDVTDLAQKIHYWIENKLNKEDTQKKCYNIIDTKYNPKVQVEIISKIFN